MEYRRGLTFGKFAPFHKGHQFLIETALSEMDEVVVVIYDCPEVTTTPMQIRAGWIRSLYPEVKIVEAWDAPKEVGKSTEFNKSLGNYLLNKLKIRDISHFYSSEFYGEQVSAALNATNRIVDANRKHVPISGSKIREAPFKYREFLHPSVYRDLITNIVFVGAPSTGKTTLATQLAKNHNTVWMPEYGREYWLKHQVDRRLTLEQLVEIAEVHLEREEKMLLKANKYLFTDTNAITTYMFSLDYYDKALPRLTELAVQAASRYDIVFLCDVDIPYEDTWERSGISHRETFQKQIIEDLIVRKIPFFSLTGDVKTRLNSVKNILSRYRKYQNVLDTFA